MQDFSQINIAALDTRIRECQLKRWWIAEQIGVDRKTITRWLTGQTRRIHADNLDRLASLLECLPEELVLESHVEGSASHQDQALAAKLIEQENLLEILTPSGKWPLLEELIKVAMQPDLPKPLLGQLYNYLSIAAWRKSELDKAEEYMLKAKQIGEETKFKSVVARARLNEATILSFRGKVGQSLEAYHECVDQQKFLEDDMVAASAMSNLGSVYHEYGDLQSSEIYQKQAIAAFIKLDKPVNISIAWIGLGALYVDLNRYQDAENAVDQALHFTDKGRWLRGFADAHLVNAWVSVAKKDILQARTSLVEAQSRYKELSISESRPLICEAMILRAEHKYDLATQCLHSAFNKHPDFPVGRTEVLREWVRLAIAMNDKQLESDKKKELNNLYTQCGCLGW